MRAVVQRVAHASVTIEGEKTAAIGRGLLILLGVMEGDAESDAQYIVRKTVGLRIFEDAAGKMNLSAADVDGELLVVSQFTLLGDARKGFRPSFTAAGRPATWVGICSMARPRQVVFPPKPWGPMPISFTAASSSASSAA